MGGRMIQQLWECGLSLNKGSYIWSIKKYFKNISDFLKTGGLIWYIEVKLLFLFIFYLYLTTIWLECIVYNRLWPYAFRVNNHCPLPPSTICLLLCHTIVNICTSYKHSGRYCQAQPSPNSSWADLDLLSLYPPAGHPPRIVSSG